MSRGTEVLSIDERHFAVRVYEDSLRIDLKGSVKDEIEEALENKPVLRESIGKILAVFVPLHVPLSDIDSAKMDKKGKITIKLPRHRDVVIQLEPENAKKLVDKLNQLAPGKKEKAREKIFNEQKSQRIENAEREYDREALPFSGGGAHGSIPAPPGVRRKERRAEQQEERR
jgi:hypothetical protein